MKKINNQTAPLSLVLLAFAFLASCSSIPLTKAFQENINRYQADSLKIDGTIRMPDAIAAMQDSTANLCRRLSNEKGLKKKTMNDNVEVLLQGLEAVNKEMVDANSVTTWLGKVSDKDFRDAISELKHEDQKTLFYQLDKGHFQSMIGKLESKKDKELIKKLKDLAKKPQGNLEESTADRVIPLLPANAVENWKDYLAKDEGKKVLDSLSFPKKVKEAQEKIENLLEQLDEMQKVGMISASQLTEVKAIIQKELGYKQSADKEKGPSWTNQIRKALNIELPSEDKGAEGDFQEFANWHRAANLARSLNFTAQELYSYPDMRTGLLEMEGTVATLKALSLDDNRMPSTDSILNMISSQISDIKLALDLDLPQVQYYLRGRIRLVQENGAPALRKLTARGTLVTNRQGLPELRMDRRTKLVKPNLGALRGKKVPSLALVLVTQPRKRQDPQLFFTFLPDPNDEYIFKLEEAVTLNEHGELSDRVYRIEPRGRVGNPYLKVRWARLKKSKRVQNRSVQLEKDEYMKRVQEDAEMMVLLRIRALGRLVEEFTEKERAIGDETVVVERLEAFNTECRTFFSEFVEIREGEQLFNISNGSKIGDHILSIETQCGTLKELLKSKKEIAKWSRELKAINAAILHLKGDIEYLRRLQKEAASKPNSGK